MGSFKNEQLDGIDGERMEVALITIDEDLAEIEELCSSAGMDVMFEMIQRRRRPHSGTFLGRGKIEELGEILSRRKVDAVVVNFKLGPKQHYKLEKELGVEVIDRIGVVLRIFTARASDSMAKLQVERARLGYEMPLVKEWVHVSKTGERPGFMGGGEYSTAAYLTAIRSRMRRIDLELCKAEREGALRREQRRDKGFLLIGLTGYTNAGKSSLLNRLAGDEVLVEDRMFSTLTTTTRKVKGLRRDILITDTIGFVRDLPPFMIEAFRSTMSEVHTADLVLLVVDGSESEESILRKVRTSMSIISPEVDPARVMVILNKMDVRDRSHDRMLLDIMNSFLVQRVVPVSALTGDGIDDLLDSIREHFAYPLDLRIDLPQSATSSALVSWLYDNTDVVSVEHSDRVRIDLRCREEDFSIITGKVLRADGDWSLSP